MEHGLYVLEGKAVYHLNGDWVEVEAGDYMLLRAFCPQTAGGFRRAVRRAWLSFGASAPVSKLTGTSTPAVWNACV